MPAYIVTFKSSASSEEVQKAKDQIKSSGGKITQEYSLIKGFAYESDGNSVSALESNPHVESVEQDGQVSTQ